MLAQTQCWNAVQAPLLRASSKEKEVIRLPAPITAAEDSNTSSASPKLVAIPAQGKDEVQVLQSGSSCQPSTSGVKEGEINLRPMTGKSKVDTNQVIQVSSFWQAYQASWEKLLTRRGLNPNHCIIDGSGKYPRVWMKPGANPHDVKQWYDFGALASVSTISPAFTEIKNLPRWIYEAVYDSWANNEQLSRGDVLELYFISAAPEPVGKGNHEAFHYIRLRRPDERALNAVKALDGDVPLVSTISEDEISTRRAWGLWVCLTEMDKVKYQFKFSQNSVNGSFLLNTMTGKTTRYAEEAFERKRTLLWENKLVVSKETHRKYCNMAHFGHWDERICSSCPNQKELEFGKGFMPRAGRARATDKKEPPTAKRTPRAPGKNFPNKR